MKHIYPFILLLFGLFISCQPEESPDPDDTIDEPHVPVSELKSYKINIDPTVFISEADLENDRVSTGDDITYFFIGVFDAAEDPMASNPHMRSLLYACGGFRYIPEDLSLSLYSNKEYTIQTLAFKKSNAYGIGLDTYEYEGIVYDRLHLSWDINYPEPAVLCDSMNYTDPWLYVSNGGVSGFNNGYIYADEDSTELLFTWPLMAKSYYETKTIETNESLTEININPQLKIFGVEVNGSGMSDSSFIEVKVGYSSDPLTVKPANNGEVYVFSGFYTTGFDLKVSQVIIDSTGARIRKTLFSQTLYPFKIGKKTIINVNLSEPSGKILDSNIELIEFPLTDGEILNIAG